MGFKKYKIELEINFDEELNEDEILEKVENELWLLDDKSRVPEIQIDTIRCYSKY